MKLAKEGYRIILTSLIVAAVLFVWAFAAHSNGSIHDISFWILAVIIWGMFASVVLFFREPAGRNTSLADDVVFSSADGTVVAIEEVFEGEYLKTNCLQLSVFMSLTNMHANWYPVSGKVIYTNHQHGKFLVAWHPKSSELNERTTTVIDTGREHILFRQIAGLVARRIVNYANVGDVAIQNQKYGFIKFGSRIDLFLPLDAEVLVSLGDKVRAGQTPLAKLNR